MIVDADRLTHAQRQLVWEWLLANGCRHLVPIDSPVTIHRGWVTVETWLLRVGEPHPCAVPGDRDRPRRSGRTVTRAERARARWARAVAVACCAYFVLAQIDGLTVLVIAAITIQLVTVIGWILADARVRTELDDTHHHTEETTP